MPASCRPLSIPSSNARAVGPPPPSTRDRCGFWRALAVLGAGAGRAVGAAPPQAANITASSVQSKEQLLARPVWPARLGITLNPMSFMSISFLIWLFTGDAGPKIVVSWMYSSFQPNRREVRGVHHPEDY